MTEPHTLQAPPSDSTLNQRVAQILLTAASIYVAAKAIEKLLRPYKITIEAIVPALRLVNRGSSHRPRPKFKIDGLDRTAPSSELVRRTANQDLYFRAAYVVNAADRIQRKLTSGATVPTALADESINYRRHEEARNQRARATRKTAWAAEVYGSILGWYLNPLLNNEIECITASGNNFRVDQIPRIGLPGAVHVGCGCYAGEPHIGAGWVDDAIDSLVRQGRLRILRNRRAS